MWHSYIFRKCCKFWHHTPLSCQKRCSKIQKIWHRNEAPYGQQISSHMEFCPKNFSFFKKIKCSKQPKKQNKPNFHLSLNSGVPNVRGGWVGSDVWDKNPKKNVFLTPSLTHLGWHPIPLWLGDFAVSCLVPTFTYDPVYTFLYL